MPGPELGDPDPFDRCDRGVRNIDVQETPFGHTEFYRRLNDRARDRYDSFFILESSLDAGNGKRRDAENRPFDGGCDSTDLGDILSHVRAVVDSRDQEIRLAVH